MSRAPDLTALVSSRICHDLISPIGAIGNGVELLSGPGGLGSPAALYLASAGIGTLALADGDPVDLTNLQRQILHRNAAVGRAKVDSGAATQA